MGKSTTGLSPGVTIDATPPDVSAAPIDVGGAYTTERTVLSAGWKGVFSDVESGENVVVYLSVTHISTLVTTT